MEKVKRFLKRRGSLPSRLISLFAAYSSVIGIVIIYAPNPSEWGTIQLSLAALAVLSILVHIVLEIKNSSNLEAFALSDKVGIEKYLHRWISEGGRVAIWTRDMSWAETEESHQLLTSKANAKELILCVPVMTEFMKQLVAAGAEVYAYGSLGGEPSSRFTIAQFGRAGARVAVARRNANDHVIEEFNEGQHPAYWLADDLVRLAREVAALRSS